MSSSSGGRCKFDVFLSFRGEDTRKIFVGHLYTALKHKAINTFIDSEGLSKGNMISELLQVIEESRLSIVVLSQNYASSTWCLKELVRILDCMDNKNQMVVPIFYQVDPAHIRKIQGTFAQSLAKNGESSNLDNDELESWRSALTRVAHLSGWDSRNYEDDAKLIEEIVESTFTKLMHTSSTTASGLVGMDSHIREMMSRLCLQVKDVRVVGIWGMGGLGKTTIARAVWDKIASQFEHSCFVDNVKEDFTNKREAQLQEKLLSTLLNEKVQSLGLNRGRNMIMDRLGTRKVLVVLDDVETSLQIEALLGNPHAYGDGSRFIVTTRDKQSLSAVNATFYGPTCLSDDKALELFTENAFKANKPKGDYHHLSWRAIEYAQGLPLALRVLGAFLHGKSVGVWEAVLWKLKTIPHIGIQDVLKTSYDGLDDSEKNIFLDIACVFRGWNTDFVTEILDSCGFIPGTGIRVLRDRALITVSEYGDEYSEVDMHDLLQDMGREMVRLEATKEPGNRSRLWSYQDVSDVLTQNTATDAVECLILDLSNSKVDLCMHTEGFVRMKKLRLLIICYSFDCLFDDQYDEPIEYSVDCCKQLTRGDLEFLSHKLRILVWHGCPLNSLPSTYIPYNLVKLDMRGGHIRQLWEGIQPLPKLKVIILSGCKNLVKIPNLTEAINLQKLFLDHCSSLSDVHSSVFALQSLVKLNLDGCKELKILSSGMHMSSLQILNLGGCSNLEKFPEISGIMKELQELLLDGTAIKRLPSSINQFVGIKELSMRNCKRLEFLPDSICNLGELTHLDLCGCSELKTILTSIHMSSLQILNLDGCSNLEKFPEISGIMKELQVLYLDETAIKRLPSSINLLVGIKELSMRNCKSLEFLPDSICNLGELTFLDLFGCSELKTILTSIHMSSLQHLYLDGCSNLEKFPEISGIMKELQVLYLDETAIKGLPSSINLLVGIKELSMRNCKSLEFLPDSICNLGELTHLDLSGCSELKTILTSIHMSSLQILNLDGCSNLEKFPEISGIMKELQVLWLDGTRTKGLPASLHLLVGIKKLSMRNCKSLEFLPDSICNLGELTHLDLSGCSELKTILTSIHMSSLQILNLHGCSNLEMFPEISGIMEKLPELCLDGTAIKRLPSSINVLVGIKKLSMRNCKSLEFLPDSICNLRELTHLDLSGCSKLKTILTSIHMSSLQILNLDGCSNLEKFPEISGIMKELSELCLDGTAIKRLPSSINLLVGIKKLSMRNCKSLEFLPDSICNLGELTHLDLSGCSELKTILTSIHMSSLHILNLDGCSNLEMFPHISGIMNEPPELCLDGTAIKRLPSSINPLVGIKKLSMSCKSFEFLPDSICNLGELTHLYLSGCSELQANLFTDIVETHSLHRENHLRPLCFNMYLPGSEVPEWFNLRDTGGSVTFHLRPKSFNNRLLGFAICIVIKFSGAPHDVSDIYGRCNWTSKGKQGEHFFKFDVHSGWFRMDRFLESDHMFLGYLPWSEYSWIAEEGLDAFKIVVETGTYSPTDDCFTSSCGVRLVYADHEEKQNSVTQPIIHVDSLEGEVDGQRLEEAVQQGEECCAKEGMSGLGAPLFPDQLEISKGVTEWEAETSESGEGRGMCEALELLPESQAESKEEEGEGCQVLGSVCCCLSLSGCTISSRKRETERGNRETRVSDNEKISELDSHSGPVVPNSQSEGKEEKELLAGKGLLGPLCSCLYWLGEVCHGNRK